MTVLSKLVRGTLAGLCISLFLSVFAHAHPRTHSEETLRAEIAKQFDSDFTNALFDAPGPLYRNDERTAACYEIVKQVQEDQERRDTGKVPPHGEMWLTGEASLARGVAYYQTHEKYFDHAFELYNVPPEILLGMFRMETWFGACIGAYNAFPALLNTYRIRAKSWRWVRDEMVALITYCEYKRCDPNDLPSSSRGAIGYSQFLPSNYWRLAIDGNENNVIDLFEHGDAIVSTARFLVERGGWSVGVTRSRQRYAVWRYNPTYSHYVDPVFRYADAIRDRLNNGRVPLSD